MQCHAHIKEIIGSGICFFFFEFISRERTLFRKNITILKLACAFNIKTFSVIA